MKRVAKFTSVLMAAMVAVSILCLPSCNDKVEDSITDLKASLEKQIANLQTQVDQINGRIDGINQDISDLTGFVIASDAALYQVLTDSINSAKKELRQELILTLADSLSNYWTIEEVQGYISLVLTDYATKAELEEASKQLQAQIDDAYNLIGQNTTDIAALTKKYQEVANVASYAAALAKNDSIRIDILERKTQNAVDSAAAALVMARENQIRISLLEEGYKTLAKTTDALKQTDEELKAQDKKLKAQIDSVANALANYASKADLKAVADKADAMYKKSLVYADSLFALSQAQLSALDSRVATLETVTKTLNQQVVKIQDAVDALQKEVENLKQQVKTNTEAISKLTDAVSNIQNALSKSISGIVLQGSVNPVFGYYALPAGIQSNILIAYYGNNEHITWFPTTSTADLVYEDYVLTEKDAEMLGGTVDTWFIPGQSTLLNTDANCGKMYMTINPNTVDLSTTTFTLVNSQDVESPIALDSVVPSQDVLTFGYTRKATVSGHAANGFYESTATLTEEGIPAVKITVNEQLKQCLKDFYKRYIKKDSTVSVSFFNLAAQLYEQFNGILPAYAVKATWSDAQGQHSVYSNYGLATTAVKPFSYAFLKDKDIKKLPTITPLSEFKPEDFKFKVPELKFNISFKVDTIKLNINMASVKFDFDGIKCGVRVPNLETSVITTDPKVIFYDTVYVQLDSLQDYLNKTFATKVAEWNTDINSQINTQVNSVIASINSQIHELAGDIEGDMNDYIEDVMDTLSTQITSKMNNYVAKMNKYIEKLNAPINKINSKLLDNPNKFLQTAMFYQGQDKNFHFISTSKATPTIFNGVGTTVIYPSSYCAEIAAPAYKKFIAVTNVFRGNTSAQEGNAACINALEKVNQLPGFNEIIDGGRYGIKFTTTSGYSGYTYEVFYSALDYSGKISQRKYYITVK